MGAGISQDEKGNLIAEFPSGKYLVNPPGLDPADVAKFTGQAGAFMLGSRLAPQTIAGQATAGGATSLGLQKATDVAGGNQGVNIEQAGVDALLGGGGQAVSNIVSGAGRIFRGVDETTTAAQTAAFAKQNNLPLMTSDINPPGTFAGRSAQSLGEKIPIAGTGGLRETQQTARQNIVKETADRYGLPSYESIMQSLTNNVSRVKSSAGKRIESIKGAMGQDPVPLNNTIKAIDDFIAQSTAPGRAFDQATISRLQEFKDMISSGDNTLDALRANRTYFREFIKGDAPVLSSQADRANAIIYKSMTDDMADAVTNKLGARESARLRDADAVYAAEVSNVKNTKLKNILSKGSESPELVANAIFSKSPSDVARVYRALDQTGRQNARAAVVHKAFEQFAKSENPDMFASALKGMGPQIDIMFRGKDRAQIKGLIKYLESTKRAGQSSVVTPTGQQLFQLGAVGDIVYTGGSGTAGAAGVGGLARLYESRPVAELMLRLSSAKAGGAEFERLSAELTRALTAQAQAQTE
jgi:hypothetical protein